MPKLISRLNSGGLGRWRRICAPVAPGLTCKWSPTITSHCRRRGPRIEFRRTHTHSTDRSRLWRAASSSDSAHHRPSADPLVADRFLPQQLTGLEFGHDTLGGGLGMGVSVDDPAGIGMIPQASGILQANAPSLHAIENIADSMLQLNSIYY